jgi:hypothetical protein
VLRGHSGMARPMRISWRLAAVLAGAVMVVVAASAGSQAAFATGQGTYRAAARPAAAAGPAGSVASAGSLKAVVCTSSANCWAVGFTEVNGALLNQDLHWNGKHWSQARIPSPGGTRLGALSELYGVRCMSSRSCWAVGYYLKQGTGVLTQALHWNGTRWSVVTTPDPGGKKMSDFNSLSDVACTSAADCWATGQYDVGTGPAGVTLNLMLHWNGERWTQASVPNPGGNQADDASMLQSIRCASARICWAVGTDGPDAANATLRNQILHWNGTKWSKVSVPNPEGTKAGDENELEALSCTSATDCMAVGRYTTDATGSPEFNEVLHWNGAKWSVQKTPNPGGTGTDDSNSLTAISCSAPKDCWAVGALANGQGTFLNEALNWNGQAWSAAPMPQPAGMGTGDANNPFGVSCTGSGNCWAVGDKASSGHANSDLILHWNGATWKNHKVG